MSLPQTLGSYQVERELGRGGMGVVYLARDPRLNRPVAIKVIPEALAHNPDNLARFEREAKLIAAVNHPNIAAIYGVEEIAGSKDPASGTDGAPGLQTRGRILILEYVPGDTLAERITRGPLPVPEALDIARQIAAAIEAAHEGGIIHRDLKPGNVKVTPDGLVKVLDFGLAKGGAASSADLAQSPTLTYSPTAIGVILGTAGYMSPEQARGKPVDRRADIWAFACVLYEMLTGRKAFEGETVSDTIARIIEREADFDALPPSTPPAIRELLRRCLEKDARKRQRDIGDVRIEIESVLAGRSSASSVVMQAPVAPPRSAFERFGLPLLAAIGGATAVAIAWALTTTSGGQTVSDPISLTVAMPPSVRLQAASFTTTGHDLIVVGNPVRPDGTEDPKRRLYLRRLDSFEVKEIPGTEGVNDYTRSPNGKWLAVLKPVSDQSTDRRLERLPIDGSSSPITIADWGQDWGVFKWLQDDQLIVLTKGGTKFIRVPSGGGTPTAETPLDFGGVEGYLGFFSELPEGRGVFVRNQSWGAQGYRQDIGLLDPKTGKISKVIDNASFPFYDAGSKHLFFSRNTSLLAVPFDLATLTPGKEPISLFDGLKANNWSNGAFEVSADGTLAFEPGGRQGSDRRIVTVDANRQVTPFIPDTRPYENSLTLSADGKRLAVVIANTRGTYEIWTATAGQPGLRRTVAQANADCSDPKWSPDGEWLAFLRNARDKDDGAYIQKSDGTGEAKALLRRAKLDELIVATAWLSDSSGVLLSRMTEPAEEPLLVRVTKDGTASPPESMRDVKVGTNTVEVSPDGKLLLFMAEDSGRNEAYVGELANGKIGPHPVLIERKGEFGAYSWGADSKRFYVVQDGSRLLTGTIERQPTLRVSTLTLAYDLKALRLDPLLFDILPDGRLVGVQMGLGEDEHGSAGVVLNWLESVRNKLKK